MNLVDRLICELDTGLRTVFGATHAERPVPSHAVRQLDQRTESIRLMRVNHAGEVSAQALYQGQALVAKSAQTRDVLLNAAKEERDHLAWCETRLNRSRS